MIKVIIDITKYYESNINSISLIACEIKGIEIDIRKPNICKV